MAKTADSTEAKFPASEKEILSGASRNAVDVQVAMDALEIHLRDAAKLVAAVEKVNGVFSSVADRLGSATFKASIDSTHGKSPREIAVSFVKELSDLACLSLQGTRELRRELVNVKASATAVLPSLRQAATGMQDLAGALKALAARQSRPTLVAAASAPSAASSILVETRPASQQADSADGFGEERRVRVSTGFLPPSRMRRYSN